MSADDLRALSKVAHATDDCVHILPIEADALADLIDAVRDLNRSVMGETPAVRGQSPLAALRDALAALDADA